MLEYLPLLGFLLSSLLATSLALASNCHLEKTIAIRYLEN